MLELGPLQVTDILVGILAFFLIDLVRQLKTLNASVAALQNSVAVETALRHELKTDIDQAHRMIREMQEEISNVRVDIAGCPKKGN